MKMKRFYKKPQGWVKEIDFTGRCINPPPLDYVSVGHTGVTPEQNFSPSLIAMGIVEGWIVKDDKTITLKVCPEDLHYTIKRVPGRYCCHCGEKLEDDNTGEMARIHVAMKHLGIKSPDKNWPHGYSCTNAFQCVLDKKQHEKYKAKPAVATVFPQREA